MLGMTFIFADSGAVQFDIINDYYQDCSACSVDFCRFSQYNEDTKLYQNCEDHSQYGQRGGRQ